MWFSLGVLSKETAILAPVALLAWQLVSSRLPRSAVEPSSKRGGLMLPLAIPLLPLGFWYAYHWWRTGFVFGNPEFLRYNVEATLHPTRILLALGLRLWQLLAYMGMYLLTLAAVAALWLPPLSEEGKERQRIAVPVQLSFLAVELAYVIALALIGGAVLARYMLPVIPLVILVFLSTLYRRVWYWRTLAAIIALGFIICLFVNPDYGFSLEDNLAYHDYVLLHQQAETFLEARYPMQRVLTAWPGNDELGRPYLGYVTRPMRVVWIEDYTVEQLLQAAKLRSDFDVALVFSTKYEPPHPWLQRWTQWQRWKIEYFGYHRDARPEQAAAILGGQLVYKDARNGQWIGIIVLSGEATQHR